MGFAVKALRELNPQQEAIVLHVALTLNKETLSMVDGSDPNVTYYLAQAFIHR